MADKIRVAGVSVGIHAYGGGASVSASFTTYTEEEGRQLEQALRDLVEQKNGTWGEPAKPEGGE